MANWLISGLGNPGSQYEHTRHNAGFWWLNQLASDLAMNFTIKDKFHGQLVQARLDGHTLFLLKSSKFMNCSGQSVVALANFYKIFPNNILVIHDDLDLPAGTARLKRGGGHGGHNGLRDIITQIHCKDFLRCRLGIAHPRGVQQVSNYVLSKPSQSDLHLILSAIDNSIKILSYLVSNNLDKAMHLLHSQQE